jgi:hypothetical protein
MHFIVCCTLHLRYEISGSFPLLRTDPETGALIRLEKKLTCYGTKVLAAVVSYVKEMLWLYDV